MSERVAIVGSREGVSKLRVGEYVCALPKGTVVVSGGARGVDTWAEFYAHHAGLDTLIFPADWKRLGKRAGLVRNQQIIAASDRLVAFWNGESRGTEHAISLAQKAGLPVEIR